MNSVWVRYFHGQTGDKLGQVKQHGSITDTNFIDMINFIIESSAPIIIYSSQTGVQPLASPQPLAIGDYDIYPTANAKIEVTNSVCLRRAPSYIPTNATPREKAFRDGVRLRDGKCVISGTINRTLQDAPQYQTWRGFQSAYVFPLARESIWRSKNFSRFITNTAAETHRAAINSVQNGMCMRNDIDDQFDDFLIAINPDDGYKIYDFGGNNQGVDRRILDPVCRTPGDPNRVSDDFLRWHWQQTLLFHMKGVAESGWESDFPPGSDMVGEILAGPQPAERMEAELFARLHHLVSDDSD
ncbi:hypothetical protein N7495_001023 [Penicillium taxi]|uniref:uncharacterized protein n=1 Tax=Penicillium taxi TaxID=168475 RepID=UPI0025451066|nr:uncharacterized protein N7495_001023 [Penicillium taxi]KAJ5908341.1 hypothetical protein N7495_001023 [Penicillium taxi]